MKSQRKLKSSQKGGECGNYTIVGELSPGVPIYGLHEGKNCSQRGGRVKASRSKKRGRKQSIKRVTKLDNKKVEQIINTLCKSIKRKCTPKYRKLLKEIVIKNM
jgi:hypothetical protein